MSRTIAIVFPQWGQQHQGFGEEYAFTEFERVVRAVGAISPLVEVEDAGIMVLSAKGPTRYFGGEQRVVEHLQHICSSENGPSGIGIASSRFAALTAAHLAVSRGSPCIIHQSVGQEFLDAIPVAALHRVGQFLQTPLVFCNGWGCRNVLRCARLVNRHSLIVSE